MGYFSSADSKTLRYGVSLECLFPNTSLQLKKNKHKDITDSICKQWANSCRNNWGIGNQYRTCDYTFFLSMLKCFAFFNTSKFHLKPNLRGKDDDGAESGWAFCLCSPGNSDTHTDCSECQTLYLHNALLSFTTHTHLLERNSISLLPRKLSQWFFAFMPFQHYLGYTSRWCVIL